MFTGGPLTIDEADARTQVGLLSCKSFTKLLKFYVNYNLTPFSVTFSLGCDLGWPPVYTRITSFLHWIGDNSDVLIRPDF